MAHNNRRTAGSSVFYVVCAEATQGRPLEKVSQVRSRRSWVAAELDVRR
jgi:hypothetical protein